MAEAGDKYAARRLGFQLARRGQAEEALALVGPQAQENPPNEWASAWDSHCLALLDRLDELQARAVAGDTTAELRLLARQGRVEELRARVAAGDDYAEPFILTTLLDHGRVDDALLELRRQIDEGFDNGGDIDPSEELAELLASHGRVDELRAEARAGNPCAGRWLIKALGDHGRIEEARQLRRYGLNTDGTTARPHEHQGRVGEAAASGS